MDSDRLLRFHRARLRAGDAGLLRARTPVGQRGSDRGPHHGSITRALHLGLDAFLSVVLAPSCAACHELLEHSTRGPVCARCWESILPLTPPLCDRCGDPLPAWRAISVPLARCPRCRRSRRLVDRPRAIGAYDRALRAIVHALKYEGRPSPPKPPAGTMGAGRAEPP